MKNENPSQPDEEIILLQDLVPRRSVKGGAGKLIFGQQMDLVEEDGSTPPGAPPSNDPSPDAAQPAASKPGSGQR